MDVQSLVKRIPVNEDFITMDSTKCNLCGRCLIVCTMSLWKKRGQIIHIAEDYRSKCVECAACYQVCETGAIQFRYPAGGTGVIYERG